MFAAMLAAIPQQADRLEALASISAPVLVIVGEQDTPFIDDSHRMVATIPGARLAVIPGGGHSPQFEATDAWWTALSDFLAELPLTAPR
jgi:pimeloyl-ACP methyl ester carboxylesterase